VLVGLLAAQCLAVWGTLELVARDDLPTRGRDTSRELTADHQFRTSPATHSGAIAVGTSRREVGKDLQ
jgi:hypothetical protein